MRSFKLIGTTIILSLFFILTSCESRETAKDNCIDHFLSEFNMKAYDGEELGCHTFIMLYEYEGTYFAYMENRCADFVPFTVYDCDGEEFCYTATGPCYIAESIYHGIIGISE